MTLARGILILLNVYCVVDTLWGFPGGSDGKKSACMQETQIQFLGQEDPQEKEVATHSSIPGWEIPWTEQPVSPSPHSIPPGHPRVPDWIPCAIQLLLTCYPS